MASRDLTTGPIPGHLRALALPVVGAMLLQSVYALIDLAWVGLLGEAAVAGLSICLQVFFVVLALSQVLGTTALADISQAWGGGLRDAAGRLLSSYLVVGAGVGLVAAVAAWLGAEPYVRALTDDPRVLAEGVAYFRPSALTSFSQLLLLVVGQGFRGVGDFQTPVRVLVATVLLNLVLDPLLMFGGADWPEGSALTPPATALMAALGLGGLPGMGIAGAAWATAICQVVGLVWYGVALTRPHLGLRPGRPALSADLLRGIVTRGLPAGFQFLLLSAALGVVLAAMKPHGPTWTAAAGGGFRILQQGILPIVATATATAAISGQNAGAGRFDRVRTACVVSLGALAAYAVVTAAAFQLAAPAIGRMFGGEDPSAAVTYFRWSSPALLGFAASLVPTFVLQALKRPVLPMLSAVARIALLAVLALGVVPWLGGGPEWVFAAFTAAAWLEGALDLLLLRALLRDRLG